MADANFNWWRTQGPLFAVNWNAANAALAPAAPLVTRTGKTKADLDALIASLEASILAAAAKTNAETLKRAERDAAKVAVSATLDLWRKNVIARLSGTVYEQDLPTLPKIGSGLEEFTKPLNAAATRWGEIDAATAAQLQFMTPPLVLPGGATLATFRAQIAAATASIMGLPTLEEGAALARRERDALVEQVHALCKDYANMARATLPADSPVLEGMPLLNPVSSRTPGAVVLRVVSRNADGTVTLGWNASDDPDITRYSIRTSAGTRYKGDDEATIGDIGPDVLTFIVDAQYVPAGSTVWGKVYVVLSSGNEAGSNAEKLTA